MSQSLPPGTAPVKAEYLISAPSHQLVDDDAAEGSIRRNNVAPSEYSEDVSNLNSSSRRNPKRQKEDKKARRGANTGRRFAKERDELELCWKIANGNICQYGAECRFTHDTAAYLVAKPKDIHYASDIILLESAPFIDSPLAKVDESNVDPECPSLDSATTCPIFSEAGECRYGFKCRFLGAHVRRDDNKMLQLVVDEDKKARSAISSSELNTVSLETLKLLRTKKYPHPITNSYLQELQSQGDLEQNAKVLLPDSVGPSRPVSDNHDVESISVMQTIEKRTGDITSQVDSPDVPIRFSEKKRLHWREKTYLAPLTTVGNLPFRRLCVLNGAEITCGEMGLANSFLAGSKEEWSLVRRRPEETIFGVQVAGNKPANLVATAEILAKELGNSVDFVDLNCGCPIDLVFKTGSGSALLDATNKLGRILIGMNKALGEIPLTVKLRTGVKDGKNTAHKLMPRLGPEFGASCITLHGRTRQQRYTKLADWDYIKQCVDAVRTREAEEDLAPMPIFGGGDCFSSEAYWSAIENNGVDGVMIGRGALIKPWIFTEIKERREWDISSRERLDMIRKLAEYGISHFGSDTAGINTARRYLCESLSFQSRYIPIGLLECMPGRINDRSPAFRGRDELETLLASDDSRDWVKISEMFLGPAPETWSFTPKHKSNAYGGEEAQG